MQALRALGVCGAIGILSGCATHHFLPSVDTTAGVRDRTGLPVAPRSASEKDAPLPPGIALDRPLSADEVAAIALWKNPQLQADLASLGLARADVIDAGLIRNPRLDTLFPVGAKPFELVLNFPVEMLWQRPRRVAAAQATYDQLAQSLVQNGLNVVRDARLAHAGQILAMTREKAADRALELRKRIAELTNVRLRAGDISELDAMAARSEQAATDEQLTRARHDTAVAMERLRIAAGLALDRTSLVVAAAPVDLASPPAPAELVAKALGARPDLRAAELAVAAAIKRGRWERSRFLVLAGQLSSKEVGTNGVLTGPGTSMELPVFNRNQGLIARADAEVEMASRQYLNLKQRVAFEVYESRELLMQAQDVLRRLREEVLPQLRRTAELAEKQYQNGDVSYLFVLEQSRGLVDAELRVADAEAAVRQGQAQMERSVGTK